MIKVLGIISIILFFSCSKEEQCIDENQIGKKEMCIEIYDPVCGCDNKSYSNSCVAENAGVLSWVGGQCPTAD